MRLTESEAKAYAAEIREKSDEQIRRLLSHVSGDQYKLALLEWKKRKLEAAGKALAELETLAFDDLKAKLAGSHGPAYKVYAAELARRKEAQEALDR